MAERFPPIVPESLSAPQKAIHDRLSSTIVPYFQNIFTVHDPKSGALVGPYAQFLYLPESVTNGYLAVGLALAEIPDFPIRCREVAILAIGEHYGAPFELYSHVRVARKVGFSDIQIQDMLEGRPPSGATEQEAVSWEVARALVGAGGTVPKGPLPQELWDRAENALGKVGAATLVHYSGYYAYTSVILNGTATPVPEGESIWPIPE
ncbi:hypothetical protein TWF481_004916 [Arthrobotrys musiformis]|uniref:Carboxymuconolactone decarboxylase-like domain-containing protein n=1 Tax=Arthrobotrys musiformis TaxID=47236 RepID=A0AAV9WLC2_9PEZI